jgi:hypothetical protein
VSRKGTHWAEVLFVLSTLVPTTTEPGVPLAVPRSDALNVRFPAMRNPA